MTDYYNSEVADLLGKTLVSVTRGQRLRHGPLVRLQQRLLQRNGVVS